MPEEKSVTPPAFPKGILQDKLNKLKAHYERFIGKKGCNPFFFLNPIALLQKRLDANEQSAALAKDINDVPLKEPKVCEPQPDVVYNVKEQLAPKGLNLPSKS